MFTYLVQKFVDWINDVSRSPADPDIVDTHAMMVYETSNTLQLQPYPHPHLKKIPTIASVTVGKAQGKLPHVPQDLPPTPPTFLSPQQWADMAKEKGKQRSGVTPGAAKPNADHLV